MTSTSGSAGSARGIPGIIWAIVIFGSLSSAGFGFDSGWWSGIMSSSQFARTFGSFDPVQRRWSLTSNQQSLGTGLGYAGVILGLLCGTGLVIVFVNPFTQEAIGGRVAFIYGSFSVLAAAFVWFIVPELRQRSLEEIDEMFQERLPTRVFASYVCRVPNEAALEQKTAFECVEEA